MWAALVSWTCVSIVVVAVIGIGIGVLSMNPPHYQIAQACFSFSAALLLGRVGWWIAFEQSSAVSVFHRIAFTVVVFAAIGVLWEESIRWLTGLQLSSPAAGLSPPSPAQAPQPKPVSEVATSSQQPPMPRNNLTTPNSEKPPTLLDLFTKDFPNILKAHDDITLTRERDGALIHIKRQVYLDFEGKTKFVGFYISEPSSDETFTICKTLVDAVQPAIDDLTTRKTKSWGGREEQGNTSEELVFSGRVFLYYEGRPPLSITQKADLINSYKAKNYDVQFRGLSYEADQVSAWYQQAR
jgi:hypothetical protein